MVDVLNGSEPEGPRHGRGRPSLPGAAGPTRILPIGVSRNTTLLRTARKVGAVCAPQAVVASGGRLPAGRTSTTPVPTWATADRPLRDGLPAFQADRGRHPIRDSARHRACPRCKRPQAASAAATGVWTEATDASPAGATKPVYPVACGSEKLVYVNAIATGSASGTCRGGFAPEQVAANTDLAIAVGRPGGRARIADVIYDSASRCIPSAVPRRRSAICCQRADFLSRPISVSPPHTAIRRLHRGRSRVGQGSASGPTSPTRSHTTTRASRTCCPSPTEQIDGAASPPAASPTVIWTLDGLKAGTYGTGGSTRSRTSSYGLSGTNAPEPQWPGQIELTQRFMLAWLLYPEGTLPVPRRWPGSTSAPSRARTLDATNDYEEFVESIRGRGLPGP